MIFTVFCCFTTWLALYWLGNKIGRKKGPDIPAPSAISIFIRLVASKFENIKSYQLLSKKYGDIFRYTTLVTVANSEYMEVLYTSPDLQTRPKVIDTLIGKQNLIYARPERSRILKKLYLRYFVNALHVESFKVSANTLVNQLRENVGIHWIHAVDCVKEAVTTAIIRNAFGVELEEYPKLRPIMSQVEHYVMISVLRKVSPFHRNDFLFNNFLGGRTIMEAKSTLNEIFSNIIERKKKEMTELQKAGKAVPNNFIFGLIQEREADEAIDIGSELQTLLLAALDTTSIAISFALIMLGMHPEIQEKVFEEDKRIQKEMAGREMEDRDIRMYEYTLRVIKETLRLYPPQATVLRVAAADVKMGEFTIPKRSLLLGSNISVHRDPKMFENPLKYDPDRFLPENQSQHQKYSYSPFGAGIRSCPGFRYAYSNSTYFLTVIVRNFKISTKYQSIDELDKNIVSYVTLYDEILNFPISLESRCQTMEIKQEPVDLETEGKIEKTKEIILREFGKEISELESDVMAIQEKIQLTQRYMKVLKYVASYGYYQNDDLKKSESGDTLTETAIHPSVQRLLPSRKEFRPESSSSSSDVEVNTECPVKPKATNVENPEQNDFTIIRGAVRLKHTLVVGNVSKWISPEYREDGATHKWMLYVRDKNRDDELGSLIQKVRYFLHESYKPHDIIDVTSAPFHLTRRGWGEFPVRVKIFFNHPNNKPIDFVHQLRLDDTSSGVQMLGGETQIDIDLCHDNAEELVTQHTKEPPKRVFSVIDESIANEHDYCSPDGKAVVMLDSKPLYQPQQVSSLALNSIKQASELSVLENWNPSTNISAPEWYFNHILNRAKNIYFLTTEACVKWFLQRWPIVTASAANHVYKMVHPYSFPTWHSYATSNTGKRRASEWFRAAKLMKMLRILHLNVWTTKQIMIYARMHGYTIVLERQYFSSPSKRFKNISTYTSQVDKTRDLRQLDIRHNSDEVDILEVVDDKKRFSPVKKSDHCIVVSNNIRFVDETAKEIGIKLKGEEVLPGVSSNVTSQMLSKVLKRFVDDLLRKSLANAWHRNFLKNPTSIEVDDVIKTIVENPEFDIFTNNGLGCNDSIVFR